MSLLPTRPSVSVVVPHSGDDTCLNQCLEGLRQQTYPHDLFEVIVVLNEPQNRALKCEFRQSEFILWEPRFSSYNARNLGVKEANGHVIAFTDSDTIPCADWLQQGVTTLHEQSADLVAGNIDVTISQTMPSPPALYELMFGFDQEKNVRGGYSATANLFALRHLFFEHGLFKRSARTGEDFEWTRSVVMRGAKLVYGPLATVKHPARETWPALFAKARRTTLPYARIGRPVEGRGGQIGVRLRFQLFTRPSPRKSIRLTRRQRFVARWVRWALAIYKIACLFGFSPRFRQELQRPK